MTVQIDPMTPPPAPSPAPAPRPLRLRGIGIGCIRVLPLLSPQRTGESEADYEARRTKFALFASVEIRVRHLGRKPTQVHALRIRSAYKALGALPEDAAPEAQLEAQERYQDALRTFLAAPVEVSGRIVGPVFERVTGIDYERLDGSTIDSADLGTVEERIACVEELALLDAVAWRALNAQEPDVTQGN